MSSNNNTQSARVNSGCNTIENQLGKQHFTKLFKNLQEAEAEELDIDSAAKEVAEMLKNIRNTKFRYLQYCWKRVVYFCDNSDQ